MDNSSPTKYTQMPFNWIGRLRLRFHVYLSFERANQAFAPNSLFGASVRVMLLK
jgi:hypothetical protein